MVTSYDSGTEPGPRNFPADGRRRAKRAKVGGIDHARLFESMRYGRRVLERFRENRKRAVEQYVGTNYTDGGSPWPVPINLIARYVQVMGRSLVPKTPRIMLSTKSKENQPAVSAMQDWVNQRMKEMHFAQTLQRWVMDALFSVGVMKVALGTPADSAVGGYTSPAGEPFAMTVDLDDFVFDTACRDFRSAAFSGHRYRIPYDVAVKLDYFDGKAKKWLDGAVTESQARFNQGGDERIGMIGESNEGGGYERDFEDMVDLWEIYLPRQKRILTYCSDAGGVPPADAPPLRDQEWVGPNCGPYHFLSLLSVPGNPMPKAPIQDIYELHLHVNSMYTKLIEQAHRQKSVLPVRGGAMDAAKNLKQAGDGEMFQAENADMLREVSFGGPSPVNAQFSIHLSDVFNKMAGNLDLLSGAAPQSKTATQDKILAEGASAGVADMQENTIVGVTNVVDSICWFLWYHPTMEMKTSRALPGLEDIKIERNLKPAGSLNKFGQPAQLARNGRYEDLHCRIDPYSMVSRTPQQRLQFLSALLKDWMPLMPVLAQQGVQFDAMATMKLISEYADEPDVLRMFTVAEPSPQAQGPGGMDSARMPTQTSREYIRRSQGADTEAQRSADMANAGSEAGADMGQ